MLELAILGLLKEHELHGYELKKRLSDTLGLASAVSFGSLYPALARLDKAGVKYEFVNYPGAVHSFTVAEAAKRNLPGMAYNKAADEDSWKRMTDLFTKTMGK